MFESAEIGHRVSREVYKAQVPALREALLDAQYRLLESKSCSLIVVVAGVDGAGKGDTVNLVQEWLDPRHVRVHGIGRPSEDEAERPPFYRFWNRIPARGKTAVFMGSWYTDPIVDRVHKRTKNTHLDTAMEHIRHFERMLTFERVVLLKLWFHLSESEQRDRLERLEKRAATRWRVSKTDWANFRLYDRFREVSGRALRETSTDYAPWLVVSGKDARFRNLTVGRALLGALERANQAPGDGTSALVPQTPPAVDGKTVLDTLDLGLSLDKKKYARELLRHQGELNELIRHPRFAARSLALVFEGADAAGKGGAIRRITQALDARSYHIVPIAAPTDEERARPYLWRFWRHLPKRGRVVLFDRSWYGRVLVERVENLTPPSDWTRAYSEINDFEEQLIDHGTIVVKCWLQIDAEEQLRRFEERQRIDFKRFKITDEDWRNREKWPDYRDAVCDMIDRTSTELAPWTLVEANDKRHARVKVLRTITDALHGALGV
ncbi:MAG: polyphosphate:AMP phosphotransferase [Sandaracinaceae bacterium]